MTKTESTIKKLREMHEAVMQKNNSLVQPEAIAIRKRIIELGGGIKDRHCQACGSLASSFMWDELKEADGYSPCCNELFVGGYHGCEADHCFHLV